MICLDTNVVIALLRRETGPLRERLRSERRNAEVVISIVVLFELRYGIAKSRRRAESEGQLAHFLELPIAVLPFGHDDAAAAATIRAQLEGAGTPIGPYDLLIAAQALSRDARLVSGNTREFARIDGLRLEDWFES